MSGAYADLWAPAAGRRCSALACGLRALLVALSLGLAATASATITNIDIRRMEETYVVDLTLWVAAPRELAFEVLVDFEHMASWVPQVRESRVLRHEAGRATVEYQGAVRLGFLAIPFTTVREVEFARPYWIRTSQLKGTMKRHESRITFTDEDKGTRLDYHAEMVPGPIAALVTNPQRVELELREHFEAIAAEILRRQEASPRSLRQGQSPSALHHPRHGAAEKATIDTALGSGPSDVRVSSREVCAGISANERTRCSSNTDRSSMVPSGCPRIGRCWSTASTSPRSGR